VIRVSHSERFIEPSVVAFAEQWKHRVEVPLILVSRGLRLVQQDNGWSKVGNPLDRLAELVERERDASVALEQPPTVLAMRQKQVEEPRTVPVSTHPQPCSALPQLIPRQERSQRPRVRFPKVELRQP
jgi:hypothetical protein